MYYYLINTVNIEDLRLKFFPLKSYMKLCLAWTRMTFWLIKNKFQNAIKILRMQMYA